jgi:hypothetical protein
VGREKCRRRCRISNNPSRSGCSKPPCIRAPRSVGNGPNMLALPRRTPASQDQVRTWQQADASDDIRNSERLVRAVVITAIGGDPHDKRLAPAWYWHRGRGSHRRSVSLHRVLDELDGLSSLLLRSAADLAMVVSNTSSLDQLIGEILGDRAAQLRAFETPVDFVSLGTSSGRPSR